MYGYSAMEMQVRCTVGEEEGWEAVGTMAVGTVATQLIINNLIKPFVTEYNHPPQEAFVKIREQAKAYLAKAKADPRDENLQVWKCGVW